MKKLITSIVFLLMSVVGYSQYLGALTKEQFNSLDIVERNLFISCLTQANVDMDSMEWIQVGDSTYEKVRMDDGYHYYYNKKTIIYNSDGSSKVMTDIGSNSLDKPKFLVAIFKYPNGVSRVTLMMYY